MKTFKKTVLILVGAAIVGIAAGCAYHFIGIHKAEAAKDSKAVGVPVFNELGNRADSDTEDDSDASVQVEPTLLAYPDSVSVSTEDFSELVSAVIPSVVAVDSTITYTQRNFFGQTESYQTSASGSGFIVTQSSSRIYIVTSNEGIEDADSVTVTFCDDTSADAEVIGQDSDYDIAVIAVSLKDISDITLSNIRVATIGDSTALQVGDYAFAIGNSMGYGLAFTVGHISALDREVTVDDISHSFIQTDAAINSGNFGGPLVNIYGEVIGINSAKYSSTEVEGIAYSIPMANAISIINDLVSYEELSEDETGYLGIEGKNISVSYSKGFSMPQGVYVYSIAEGSPAADSELNVGDIIVGINGRSITTMTELQNRLEHLRAGQEITLNVRTNQGGRYVDREISVTLGSQP